MYLIFRALFFERDAKIERKDHLWTGTNEPEENRMTFHCKNYDIENDKCNKLKGECVPARKGCVLEGRMAVSEELADKIKKIDEETARRSKSQ